MTAYIRPDAPFSYALADAIATAATAEHAWVEDVTCDADHDLKCSCASSLATRAADDAVVAARLALRKSDEPREYTLRYEGGEETTITCRPSELDARIDVDVRSADWDTDHGTIYIDVWVSSIDGTQHDKHTVTIAPQAPDCAAGHEHDWRSPIELVGGIGDNPGVWGHGGGVTIDEVCCHCGARRHTDTWAQRMDTGEQGLTEVTYEEPDEASLAWVEERQSE